MWQECFDPFYSQQAVSDPSRVQKTIFFLSLRYTPSKVPTPFVDLDNDMAMIWSGGDHYWAVLTFEMESPIQVL